MLRCLLLIFLGLCACRSQTPTSSSTDAVAVVNGTVITKAAFSQQLEQVAQFRTTRHFTDDQKKAILLDMIHFELLLQQANKENFFLKNEAVRRFAVNEYLLEYINQRYTVSDVEAENFYQKQHDAIDNVCVRHILVDVKKRTAAEALKKSEELITKLKQHEDFAQLAIQESDDSGTREQGGDLGCFSRQQHFMPEFLQASFALKTPGDYTNPPIKTSYGYHIILLTQDKRGFARNREAIKKQLTNQRRQEALETILLKLKQDAKITPYFENLGELNLNVVATPTPTP